jgi:Zn-dependent protease with chaperone function
VIDIAAFYPPAPANVPEEITRLDPAYRKRVAAMIGGLFLFLLLYFVIISLAGLFAIVLLILPMPTSFFFLVIKLGGALAAGLLCLFLIKGLFKGRRVERSSHIELRPRDHPELFAFIERVYTDTGSRRPRRVYASPDVNAALIYDTSLLNLIVPPKKDLLIGMGLVNVVDMIEFKAVLSHEFGHFAQRSVGFGSYLYVANQVMHDVIYSRDALDRFVDQWAGIDLRISFPAWGLKGVLWAVRGILSGMYRSLNLLHLSLSRQMEFNADNVAVSVTGSDAIIHGLARLEFANEALGDAGQSLNAAADHGMFTDDLFFHQSKSMERLRRTRKNDRLGLAPELPASGQSEVFAFVDDGTPDKFRSHPTDHMREKNAKRIYVRSPEDGRSPWLLFGKVADLKVEVTGSFYRRVLDRRERYNPRPAELVQAFVDAEHAEVTYDPRYHGWYDDRFINPGDLDLLPSPWSQEALSNWFADWPAKDLEMKNATYRERQSELSLLQGLSSGDLQLKGRTFKFRERDVTMREVKGLLKDVDEELTAFAESFHERDREILVAHRSIARELDAATPSPHRENELLDRYRFHMTLQGFLQTLLGEQNRLNAILSYLSNNSQLQEGAFGEIRDGLDDVRRSLNATLKDSRKHQTPTLTNVEIGSSLHDLIVDRGDRQLERLEGDRITSEWIGKLHTRLEGVVSRLKRLHFKSLGGLLSFQEKLIVEGKGSANASSAPNPASS